MEDSYTIKYLIKKNYFMVSIDLADIFSPFLYTKIVEILLPSNRNNVDIPIMHFLLA